MARGDRYPGLGLHWLLGLVRLRQGDREEALGEFDREMKLANPNRLYGREYRMSALHARGMCLLEMGKPSEAITAFQDGLAVYPEHAQTQVALTMAFRATGSAGDEQSTRQKLAATIRTLTISRPIEATLVESQLFAADGKSEQSAETLARLLDMAPPGFAAWTLPVDPLFRQLHGNKAFGDVLQRLAARAR